MRVFSTLIITAAFALSANASSLNKRTISGPVQICIDDINAASAQVSVLSTAVDAFTSAAGYPGVLNIHNKEQQLEARLKIASTDCCAVSGTITSEEAEAVLSVISPLVPQITRTLKSMVDKKPEFDAVPLATSLIKKDINSLATQTKNLNICLVATTPLPYLPIANSYVDQISNAFDAAKAAYDI